MRLPFKIISTAEYDSMERSTKALIKQIAIIANQFNEQVKENKKLKAELATMKGHEKKKPKQTPYESVFEALPLEFTQDDVTTAAALLGHKSPTKAIICRWKASHLIRKRGIGQYVKTIND